ncbi:MULTISPECIES: hypothetical protein [Pseudomonas]|uniref:Uncharacterized protein n=2 Tax=Pseudomonas TaxID=286 RepID=A0A2R7UF68_PSEDL|nr:MULTISPECIES: hypothetical protein [Pseudomonas]MBF8644120.1 hypothetical protein [Pseudomonas pudica]MBF8758513.1 hypothetical protein [Pseudomonas pudica]MRF39984.1 hypothetical protein [Escherichia coli]PTU50350.1 hypothetical protein DBB42_20510 [Pseudomonas plecoglossicida]
MSDSYGAKADSRKGQQFYGFAIHCRLIAAAYLQTLNNLPQELWQMEEMETILAPGGRFAVKVAAWEARNSQWVYVPSLLDRQTQAVIFAFADPRWSMDQATWRSHATVHFVLRKFPGDHHPATLELLVNCANQTAVVVAGTEHKLAEIEQVLEAAFEKKPSAS